ncbi:MAG: DUF4097 family beta strand repeat-containing protein [Candidatus Angelobacter sp.]
MAGSKLMAGLRRAVRRQRPALSITLIVLAAAMLAGQASAADTQKEARLEIAPGGTVNITNNAGSVSLKAGAGNQVQIAYTTHSDKVEVDHESTSNKRRIEIRTHPIGDAKPSSDESKVDYEITVPAGVSVRVATSTAPITVDGLSGDITLFSDTGEITVSNVARSHLHIHGVAAPVSLSKVNGGHVDVTSNQGAVQLVDVTGPNVNVGSSSGNISYQGDCSGTGDYVLTTHSGNIDVLLPQTASVDLSARSVKGSVENDFPLQKKAHPTFVSKAGSSFAGTSNSGSSSIELQSFSGRIRVKKQ